MFRDSIVRVIALSIISLVVSSCEPSPDSKYSREMDLRRLPVEREDAEEAASLYQATLRGGGDPKLSPQMRQAVIEQMRQDAEIKAMVYHDTLRRVQRASTASPTPY